MSDLSGAEAGHLDAAHLEAIFAAPEPLTIGLEEEVMLLEPESHDLASAAASVLGRLAGDPRFKAELPASQVEILTEPSATALDALRSLAAGRRDLVPACDGLASPAAAGVHPFAKAEGELNDAPRYERVRDEYGWVARRQLVASLQVQVAVGDAARTLSVYNRLREHLPEIAALAANAAFYEGRDTGLASVRPLIATLLPRQGVPPALESWTQFAEELRWGARANAVVEPRLWWWELRPHPGFGTLEVRVPDSQTTLADAAGVVATVHSLVAWLAERTDSDAATAPAWRIEENRWSAARHGVEGQMTDLRTGDREATRARLHRLLDELEPVADRLGSIELLGQARRLAEANGTTRQRRLAANRGVEGMTGQLAEAFLDEGALAHLLRPDEAG